MRTAIALLLIFGGGYVMYIGITGNLPFVSSGESSSGPPPQGNSGGESSSGPPPQNNGSSFNFLQPFGAIPPGQGIR